VRFLLDTNACIAIINGKPPAVRARFDKAVRAGDEFFVSTITAFELWYGVAKSARAESNAVTCRTFFAGPLVLLPFEEQDAQASGMIRAAMGKKGTPIGAYDLLIAGQALRHPLTLVTANSREFSRIPSLRLQNWSRP
jgi:tRNA(fMet)-specific endonuclease VapC